MLKLPLSRLMTFCCFAMVLHFMPCEAGPVDSLWIQVPLQTQESRDAGNWGGEGCQVITNFACDSSGQVIIFGTDVGGLYRSLDGGQRWEPANVGYKPRGSAYVAIDPANADRMLSVGANADLRRSWHGLWLSTDRGATWTNVLPKDNDLDSGPCGRGGRILVYDPSSVKDGQSQVAYWATERNINAADAGLWKTADGGKSWAHISSNFSGAWLALHPANGTLYLGTDQGLFQSTDGGQSFSMILSGAIRGVATTAAEPGTLVALRKMDLERSLDGGAHWTVLADATNPHGLPTSESAHGDGWYRIEMSPVDPNLMHLVNDSGNWTDQENYDTCDGGKTWFQPLIDRTSAFINPKDSSIVWSNGGDMAFRSTDGGKSFHWFNNGYAGYTCASICNFNAHHPGIFLLTSQDYESALTVDGGKSWKYLDPSHTNNSDGTPGWGGFQYSGYAFDENVLLAGCADSWVGPRKITTSFDGGRHFTDSGVQKTSAGVDTSLGDPDDSNVAFYGNDRTDDHGKTWKPMLTPDGKDTACAGVFTYDADPAGTYSLFGSNHDAVVRSTDHGITWSLVHQFATTSLTDIAYDWKNRRLYVCTEQGQLVAWNLDTGTEDSVSDRLIPDCNGARIAKTVCIDPVDPSVVYCGNHADVYLSDAAVQRSIDGGKTWTNLMKEAGQQGLDGGHEPFCLRVQPDTRELWVQGECFGLWKYPPPR